MRRMATSKTAYQDARNGGSRVTKRRIVNMPLLSNKMPFISNNMPLLTNKMPLSGIKAGFLTVIPATSCLSQQIDPTDCRIRFKVTLMYYFALQVGVFEEFLCVFALFSGNVAAILATFLAIQATLSWDLGRADFFPGWEFLRPLEGKNFS